MNSHRNLYRAIPRTIIASLMLVVLPLGSYVFFTKATGNFHEVSKGVVYRSGQLSAEQLRAKASQLKLQSVLNMRGNNSGQKWYDEELALCESIGIRHLDFETSAGKDLSISQMEKLIDILHEAPKPMLIHCKDGADRAALASALYLMAVDGKTPVEAAKELTMWYGHIPFITPHVAAMDRSLCSYVKSRSDSQTRSLK